MRLPPVLRLMRPHQWTKNVLVFAALLFAGDLTKPLQVAHSLMAFAALCMLSSATYILNDLRDVARDRAHPLKRHRPLASELVSKNVAIALATLLLVAGLGVSYLVGEGLLMATLVYLGVQFIYNGGLKHIAIADVFSISFGFVIRAVAGAVAIDRPISGWLILCTAALALLIGFGKRRHEFLEQGGRAHVSRESLADYNIRTLDAMILLSAAAACLCYGVYAVESQTAARYPALILTTPAVWYGVFRYLLLVLAKDEGGEPEYLLFSDRQIVICMVAFLVLAILALSGLELPWIQR